MNKWKAIDKDLLIEALYIAKDDFDFDGEHEKADAIGSYIKEVRNG